MYCAKERLVQNKVKSKKGYKKKEFYYNTCKRFSVNERQNSEK